jgi:hypothetical protein
VTEKEVGFLSFNEFISLNAESSDDWVTVARFDGFEGDTSFGIFSVLVSKNKTMIKKLLSNSDWEVQTSLGTPFFGRLGQSKSVYFNLGDKEVIDGIRFKAFTIVRQFHDAHPMRVDIDQSFVLYHGLYFISEEQVYIDPVTEEKVIKYENPSYVKIKTSYLRDYLAAVKMVLVRYHDHRRMVKKEPLEAIGKEEMKLAVKSKDRNFSIRIGNSIIESEKTFSRLLGKDIIYPFKEPKHPDFLLLSGKDEKRCLDFIIGVDNEDNDIEETCNEKELSSFFVNTGKANYLTPVYFKNEVLQKYYQNPRRYTVSPGYLHSLDMWGVSFDINKSNLVHVWLGDLGRLPYEEQLHFRQYNVRPSGGITTEFYDTQILAKFSETKEPIHLLKKSLKEVNKSSLEKLGFKIFQELTDDDAHAYKTIHVPTTNEPKELDEQLIYLSKILSDSIDKAKIKSRIIWRPSTPEEDTHLRFLEKLLEETFGVENTKTSEIVQPLRLLQRLRSQSAAHRKSTEFRDTLSKLGLDNKTPKQVFEIIVSSLVGSLTSIKTLLSNFGSKEKL